MSKDLSHLRVAVIGGGLGGLCAALCFARRDARVTVYEAAEAFGEVGAGIQVSANGLCVLRAIGVDPSSGVLSRGVTLNDHQGRRIATLPNSATREVRYFHRADLLTLLERAVRSSEIELRLGTRVSPDALPDADLVIAADGVKSVLRGRVAPDLASPCFSGQVAWRAIVELPNSVGEAGANVYMGLGRHVVLYPMRDGRLLNLVAGEDMSDPLSEGWQQEIDIAEFADRFTDFGGPLPELLGRARPRAHKWGLYNHALPKRWSDGNVVLIGDAAHAMLPYLAQGACMAFEDAYILAKSLAKDGDLDAALGAYERVRSPRVARVMKEVRANATRFHHSSAAARFFGHGALRLASTMAPGLIARRFDWLYDYDPTT